MLATPCTQGPSSEPQELQLSLCLYQALKVLDPPVDCDEMITVKHYPGRDSSLSQSLEGPLRLNCPLTLCKTPIN